MPNLSTRQRSEDPSQDSHYRETIRRLACRHGTAEERVEQLYAAMLEDLGQHATIEAFLPLLAEKHVHDILRQSGDHTRGGFDTASEG